MRIQSLILSLGAVAMVTACEVNETTDVEPAETETTESTRILDRLTVDDLPEGRVVVLDFTKIRGAVVIEPEVDITRVRMVTPDGERHELTEWLRVAREVPPDPTMPIGLRVRSIDPADRLPADCEGVSCHPCPNGMWLCVIEGAENIVFDEKPSRCASGRSAGSGIWAWWERYHKADPYNRRNQPPWPSEPEAPDGPIGGGPEPSDPTGGTTGGTPTNPTGGEPSDPTGGHTGGGSGGGSTGGSTGGGSTGGSSGGGSSGGSTGGSPSGGGGTSTGGANGGGATNPGGGW